MKSLLIHPKNAAQLEGVKLYLTSIGVEWEVQESASDDELEIAEGDTEDDEEDNVASFDDFKQKRIDIKPEMLKEIADYLDMGMICYYHKTRGELEYMPDEMQNPGFEEEFWEDVINKINDNESDYIRFEAMSSSEAFRVMEGFIGNIDHIPTHNKFIDAISRKKPFRNFTDLLHYYPELREQWFAYKSDRYIEYVKEQLEFE